jgi:hypothetical protein
MKTTFALLLFAISQNAFALDVTFKGCHKPGWPISYHLTDSSWTSESPNGTDTYPYDYGAPTALSASELARANQNRGIVALLGAEIVAAYKLVLKDADTGGKGDMLFANLKNGDQVVTYGEFLITSTRACRP